MAILEATGKNSPPRYKNGVALVTLEVIVLLYKLVVIEPKMLALESFRIGLVLIVALPIHAGVDSKKSNGWF